MLIGTLLNLMEQLGADILTLTSGVSEDEFFKSRLTSRRTLRLLDNMSKSAASLPFEVKQRMPEIDWASWEVLSIILPKVERHPLQIWVAIQELVPLTVHHLRNHRRLMPRLFAMVA